MGSFNVDTMKIGRAQERLGAFRCLFRKLTPCAFKIKQHEKLPLKM